jgi:hypothetical protein
MSDAERLDFLDALMSRREYQNSVRPSEPVGADLHITHNRISLYLRDLCGRVTAEGQGSDIRACLDAAMAQVRDGKDDAVRRTPRLQQKRSTTPPR